MDAMGNVILPSSELTDSVINLKENIVHPGLYFLVLNSEKGQIIKKLIVK